VWDCIGAVNALLTEQRDDETEAEFARRHIREAGEAMRKLVGEN